jgi:predicted transposase/invertase (TIGR01784 family)
MPTTQAFLGCVGYNDSDKGEWLMAAADKRKTRAPKSDAEAEKQFDHDGLWKDFIERFFYELLESLLPELYEAADTTRQPYFLDKEFRDVLNTGDPEIHASPRFADYVIRVPLKNGDAEWLILHVEVQGKGGGDITVRMYHYKSLIFAHFRKEPVALAIITDARPRNEASYYSHSSYGTKTEYVFNVLVLGDMDDEKLLASDNPIDLAFYAAKCALKSKNETQKYKYLRMLTKLLAERGWSAEDKRDLMLFIERFLYLKDEALQEQHWEYRQELNKEGKIVNVSFLKDVEERIVERRGMEKGREEGMEEGKEVMAIEMARKLLAKGISPSIIAETAGLPLSRIQGLMN